LRGREAAGSFAGVRARDGNGDAVYHLRFSGDADGADTYPTLVRPDRCATTHIGTSDCGRLTHERGGQVATNRDCFGHRYVKRHVYTSGYANLKSSKVDG